jgi:hypothetical protein
MWTRLTSVSMCGSMSTKGFPEGGVTVDQLPLIEMDCIRIRATNSMFIASDGSFRACLN